MKNKFHLKVLGNFALSLGALVFLVSPTSGRAAWTALAGTTGLMVEKIFLLPLVDLPYTEYVTNETEVNPGVSGAVIATCPDDSIVVGGGYAAESEITFYTQYKYENGWRGDAQNNSAAKQQITVFAVCLHNLTGLSVTQVHGQDDVAPGLKANAIASCPAGSLATGGGFYAYPDGSLRVYNSSRAYSGEGWQSWAKNLSDSTKTLHPYANCLSGSDGKIKEILESVSIPPSSQDTPSPPAPAGRWSQPAGSPRRRTCSSIPAQDRTPVTSGKCMSIIHIPAMIRHFLLTLSAWRCKVYRKIQSTCPSFWTPNSLRLTYKHS